MFFINRYKHYGTRINTRFFNIGHEFIGIGPLTDYHGIRRPCTIKVTDLLNGVAEKNPDYWDMLTNKGQFWKT